MKKFLLTVAAILAITTATHGQAKAEPGSDAKKEAPKPVSVTMKVDTVLTADVMVDGDCTFAAKTIFLQDLKVKSEIIVQRDDQIEEPLIVKGLKTVLPQGMKVVASSKLTLPPGAEMPKQPSAPPEPKRYQIGKRSVTVDKVRDPANREAIDTYVLEKLAELEKRMTKVEEAVKKLTPKEKADRLSLKPTGQFHATYNATRFNEVNGKPVVFRYEYYQQGCSYKTFVYEYLE